MNNDNDVKRTNSADERIQPRFMSFAICQQQSHKQPSKIRQQPPKNLERKGNKSEVKEKSNCRSTWINYYIPNSSTGFRRSRTSFEVSDTNCTTIANRIFDSNKIRSIYAVYDKAIMRCKTPSHVIFTIRLVRSAQEANTILIDVRRRSGCAMLFRDEFQALFHAAVHGDMTTCEGPRSTTYQADKGCKKIDYIPLDESDIDLSIKAASVDVQSKMHDACVVTLQDLSLTTNPQSKETSLIACNLILDKYCNIFEYIIDDIRKQVDYSCGNRHDNNSREYMRSLTLGLLGNILMVVPKHSTLISLIQDKEHNFSVIKSLQWYVRMAKECPLNASLATKCLRLFVQTDSRLTLDIDANASLENARRFGQLTYPNLEKEAQAALTAIQV